LSALVGAGVFIGAYLLGSISFAFFITKSLAGVDLRTVGSGNLGATNAGRVLGKKWAVGIYLLDGLKGVGAVLLTRLFGAHADLGGIPLAIIAGFGVMLGHIFPFYLRFKGGKGVATGSGVVCALSPIAGIATFFVWFLTLKLSRMVSAGSIVAAVALPFLEIWAGRDRAHRGAYLVFFILVGVLVIVMHRKNIARIFSGTEPRVGAAR
jgi:glycerol-3-phosphate acyltransferase PlsY